MSYEFFNTKVVTTRKPHRCEQCHRSIAAGERCFYGAGLFDGHFMSYYEHEDCRAAWSEVMADVLRDDDVAPFLADYDYLGESRNLLSGKYPAVAARLWPEHAA